MAMHATPFSNSVAVGTEGVKPLWGALDEVTEAVLLARLVVGRARSRSRSACCAARWQGFTAATELANRLVLGTGISFRRAHHRVGEAVTAAAEPGEPLQATRGGCWASWGCGRTRRCRPAAVAAAAAYGGGPGPPRCGASSRSCARSGRRRRGAAGAQVRWAQGARALDAAARSLAPAPGPPAP